MALTPSFDSAAFEKFIGESAGVAAMLKHGGDAVRMSAQDIVPVRTGALKDSIQVETGIDDKGPYARIGSELGYAIFVELGTRKMSAQPYLRPSLSAGGDAKLRDYAAGQS